MAVRTVVVLFNRDLRVHDHPALAEAVRRAETVVPLFVVDDAVLASGFAVPNRAAFLVDSLSDLRVDTARSEAATWSCAGVTP